MRIFTFVKMVWEIVNRRKDTTADRAFHREKEENCLEYIEGFDEALYSNAKRTLSYKGSEREKVDG